MTTDGIRVKGPSHTDGFHTMRSIPSTPQAYPAGTFIGEKTRSPFAPGPISILTRGYLNGCGLCYYSLGGTGPLQGVEARV